MQKLGMAWLSRIAALGAAWLSMIGSQAAADVVMPPPPHHSDIAMALQKQVIARLGGRMNGTVHKAQSSIVVAGAYGVPAAAGPFEVLIRDQAGWTSWASGKPRPIGRAAGAELDRLLGGDNLWREDGFVYGQPCPGDGRRMQFLHRGRDKTTRQMCAPAGLVGRLAEIAISGRVPAGPLPAAGGQEEASRTARGSDYERKRPLPSDVDSAELIMFLKGRSTYALRDGDVAEHLEPYARDVTMVWQGRVERGLAPLRRRAAAAIWNGVDKRHITPGEGYVRQTGPDRFEMSGTYHYWHADEELRFPFITHWRKRRGIWQIVREQISPAIAVN